MKESIVFLLFYADYPVSGWFECFLLTTRINFVSSWFEMDNAEQSMKEAEVQREKRREAFEQAHQELAETMASLDKAIEILSK